MNTDIRVKTTFPHHHKTKKLRRKLGNDGVCALLFLWLFASENRPDGIFSGMDEEDIAIAAQWDGDAHSMLVAMLDVGFLELSASGEYLIHDWLENNAWAADAPARKAKAVNAAKTRWEKRNRTCASIEKLTEDLLNATSKNIDARSIKKDALSNAPSPNPSPSPSPSLKTLSKKPRPPSGDHQLFIAWWCFASQKICDQKTSVNGKSVSLVQQMLKNVDGVKRLIMYASVVLTSEDPFYKKAGRTLGGLSSQLDAFKSRKNDYDVPLWRLRGIAPPEEVMFEDWKFWEVADESENTSAE